MTVCLLQRVHEHVLQRVRIMLLRATLESYMKSQYGFDMSFKLIRCCLRLYVNVRYIGFESKISIDQYIYLSIFYTTTFSKGNEPRELLVFRYAL